MPLLSRYVFREERVPTYDDSVCAIGTIPVTPPNESWLAAAWHPDSQLGEQLKQDAIRIRDAMQQIMQAGVEGAF